MDFITVSIDSVGWSYVVEQLINALTLGSIYGLIAIGYTMVYGIIGMINFAHGEVFMVGAFASLIMILAFQALGLDFLAVMLILAIIMAMITSAAYGFMIERVAYRPLRGSFRLAPLITAIGCSIFLQNYVQLNQQARPKPIEAQIEGGFTLGGTAVAEADQATGAGVSADAAAVEGGVFISYINLLIVIVTVVILAIFWVIISRTALGRAQRSCEQDRKMAALVGVNVDRTIALTFVMGGALAAVAGMMFVLKYGVIDFYIGFLAGVKAFTAAVLGGIGSLPGAMLGGLLLGMIEVFWGGFISQEYKDVAAFLILAIVLIFLPEGLLGKPEVEKV